MYIFTQHVREPHNHAYASRHLPHYSTLLTPTRETRLNSWHESSPIRETRLKFLALRARTLPGPTVHQSYCISCIAAIKDLCERPFGALGFVEATYKGGCTQQESATLRHRRRRFGSMHIIRQRADEHFRSAQRQRRPWEHKIFKVWATFDPTNALVFFSLNTV